jgi:hypothetical protein
MRWLDGDQYSENIVEIRFEVNLGLEFMRVAVVAQLNQGAR